MLSSAGITAGIDLALHLIDRLAGPAFAQGVAREMVVFMRRSGQRPAALALALEPQPRPSCRPPRPGRARARPRPQPLAAGARRARPRQRAPPGPALPRARRRLPRRVPAPAARRARTTAARGRRHDRRACGGAGWLRLRARHAPGLAAPRRRDAVRARLRGRRSGPGRIRPRQGAGEVGERGGSQGLGRRGQTRRIAPYMDRRGRAARARPARLHFVILRRFLTAFVLATLVAGRAVPQKRGRHSARDRGGSHGRSGPLHRSRRRGRLLQPRRPGCHASLGAAGFGFGVPALEHPPRQLRPYLAPLDAHRPDAARLRLELRADRGGVRAPAPPWPGRGARRVGPGQ